MTVEHVKEQSTVHTAKKSKVLSRENHDQLYTSIEAEPGKLDKYTEG